MKLSPVSVGSERETERHGSSNNTNMEAEAGGSHLR